MWDIVAETFNTKPEECLTYIKENWDKIPILNNLSEYDIKEGQLVKFCGMIQDMPNPVYYYSSYEILNNTTGLTEIKSGKYRDSLHCNENETLLLDSPNTQNQERFLYSCITIPALNEWVKPINDIHLQNHEKSTIDPCSSKRNIDEMEVDNQKYFADGNKRFCSKQVSSNSNKISSELNTNFPISCAQNYSCVIHIYENSDYNLKVNDIVEACGFIHYNILNKNDDDTPYSNIPRLHAVFYRTIKTFNPYVKIDFNEDDILIKARELRSELHLLLTQIFLGDSLAADYMICHLITKIYGRMDCTVLGKFSINFSNIPFKNNNYIANLYNLMSQLLPKTHYMPMSLEVMNSTQMVPKKDYEKDHLQTGLLQLTDHTHLIIDETKLGEGKLEEKGMKNFQAIKYLIEHQKLDYDFKFFNVEFTTDIPVLILSEGKSLLPSDCHIVLSPELEYLSTIDECCTSVNKYLQDSLLVQLRKYISVTKSVSTYTLPENLQQTIENDLVQQRQIGEKSSAEDFHLRLVLARLLSLSYGEKELTKTVWDKSGEMEICRKLRLNIKNR